MVAMVEDASGSKVRSALERLEGSVIWHVSLGGPVGSTFSLAMGEAVRRGEPLKNLHVSERFRDYEGQFGLYVWCSWRFETDDRLASSDQEAEIFGPVLRLLDGSKVRSATANGRVNDLRLETTAGTLFVFCDHVPPEMSFGGNWEMTYPGGAIAIGPGFAVEFEARE